MIVAKSFSEQIIAAQGANSRMEDFQLVYLEPTGLVDEQEAALEDLALITGGQVLRTITGHSLHGVTRAHLGESELAWVDRNRFGIIAGGGDEGAVEREVEALEARYARSDDERQQEVLRARIGRLRGGSAVVYAAGSSESEMRYQKDCDHDQDDRGHARRPAGRDAAGRRDGAAALPGITAPALRGQSATCMKERPGPFAPGSGSALSRSAGKRRA